MLKLRDGWQSFTTENFDTYLYSPDKPTTSWNYHVDMDDDMVAAFPHGGLQCRVFDTIEEAHEYLLSVGSESPWEES